MFGEEVHGGGRPFQIFNGLVSGALLGLDIVLNVSEQADLPVANGQANLPGWRTREFAGRWRLSVLPYSWYHSVRPDAQCSSCPCHGLGQ